MVTYTVIKEIKTPWWFKILRFFHLKSKREEFEICFNYEKFEVGEMLSNGDCNIKVINKICK